MALRMLLLAGLLAGGVADHVSVAKRFHAKTMAQARAKERRYGHLRRSNPVAHTGPAGLGGEVITPSAFGADPTGRTDSTQAMLKAFAALTNRSERATVNMADNITDMGGLTLDLQGGVYLISATLPIPTYVGNLHVKGGTLRASKTFPSGGYLITVGSTTCSPHTPGGGTDHQGSCNEFIGFSDMLFDSSLRAAGGIEIAKVMGTTLHDTFHVGFVGAGIKIDAGHEVLVTDGWLSTCYWSGSAACKTAAANSIGVQINGNDHYLTNVIVFDWTKVGVQVNGAANILSGVHTWNGGGVGIQMGTPSNIYGGQRNRLTACYLDYNTLDMYDPYQSVVEDTFFLATHAILHAVKGKADGVQFRANVYTTPQSVVLDGTFTSITGVRIADEINAATTTRATKTLTLKGATKWVFDFSKELLFDSISRVTYSVTSDHAFFSHLARTPVGRTVTVETSEAVDATITLTAEQG
eukprot:Hpha_TRINITY_DN16153_c2_g5::TRINITY_DN16153_c2_g5_i1::g.4270::m.4270